MRSRNAPSHSEEISTIVRGDSGNGFCDQRISQSQNLNAASEQNRRKTVTQSRGTSWNSRKGIP